MRKVRTYGQYCPLAKALDLVGDRWTLLVVRELLVRDGLRYTDIQRGLPGVATNLLAARLREMEVTGLIRREDAPAPVAATLYHLTDRGRALRPSIAALGAWGAPLLAVAPPDDVFHTSWLAVPIEELLRDHDPSASPVTIELRTGNEPLTISVDSGAVTARPGAADAADLVLEGDRSVMLRLLVGRSTLESAQQSGLDVRGDPRALARVQPAAMVLS